VLVGIAPRLCSSDRDKTQQDQCNDDPHTLPGKRVDTSNESVARRAFQTSLELELDLITLILRQCVEGPVSVLNAFLDARSELIAGLGSIAVLLR
jgi:hypothetical protein